MDYCYEVSCITLETKCAKLIHLFVEKKLILLHGVIPSLDGINMIFHSL